MRARVSTLNHSVPLHRRSHYTRGSALARLRACNATASSWFSFGSILSTCELRNHCRSDPVQVQSTLISQGVCPQTALPQHTQCLNSWAEAPIKIARMTLTIKLDGNWSSFQLANNTPPLSVTGSVIAPSARMHSKASSPKRRGYTGPTQCFGWHGPDGPKSRGEAQKHLSAPLRQALLPMPTRQWHHSVHFITHQSFAFY